VADLFDRNCLPCYLLLLPYLLLLFSHQNPHKPGTEQMTKSRRKRGFGGAAQARG
jgi:hypothetical protein